MDVNDTEGSHVLMPADVVGTEYYPLLNAGSEGKAFLNFTYYKVCDGCNPVDCSRSSNWE